jgi:hypothetical protein
MPAASLCEPRRIETLSASYIAKADLSVPLRGLYATRWIKGSLEIERRTGSLAAKIFDVSPGTISRTLVECADEPAVTLVDQLVHLIVRATHDELAQVGKFVGVDAIWDGMILPNVT